MNNWYKVYNEHVVDLICDKQWCLNSTMNVLGDSTIN